MKRLKAGAGGRSNVDPAGDDASPTRNRHAGFWRRAWSEHKYALPFEIFYACVIGVALLLYQNHLDSERTARDRLFERDRAVRAEVLANVQFVRETVRDNPGGAKNFQGLNLNGADLSGLDLGCDLVYTSEGINLSNESGRAVVRTHGPSLAAYDRSTCADFSGADLTGVTLNGTDLSGALFAGSKLSNIRAYSVTAPGLIVSASSVSNTSFEYSDLRGATFSADPIKGHASVQTSAGSVVAIQVTESYVSGLDVRGYVATSEREMWTTAQDTASHVDQAAMRQFVEALCPVRGQDDPFGRFCPGED